MKTLRRAALVAATMSLAVSGFTLPASCSRGLSHRAEGAGSYNGFEQLTAVVRIC